MTILIRYAQLFSDYLGIRCRRKKFTFATSSPGEFLIVRLLLVDAAADCIQSTLPEGIIDDFYTRSRQRSVSG